MPTVEELRGKVRMLRERLSRLSEASLRISESLDVDTVLREVVQRARELTGAGCSGIVTMDASGQLQDFVTAGISPGEYQRFPELPRGPALWEYLREMPEPRRLGDLAAHLSSLGLPEYGNLARSFPLPLQLRRDRHPPLGVPPVPAIGRLVQRHEDGVADRLAAVLAAQCPPAVGTAARRLAVAGVADTAGVGADNPGIAPYPVVRNVGEPGGGRRLRRARP